MKNLTHDLAAMAEKITRRTKAIFIANPNNPTGTYVDRADADLFFSRVSTLNFPLFIVFDEAYYEYARNLAPDYPETMEYFFRKMNVVILRTFSKIYGLAGLRVGYGVAQKEIVCVMDRVRPPFNVSSAAQETALAALGDDAHVKKSVQLVAVGMDFLADELKRLGFKTVPSVGNFILVDCAPRKGSEIFDALLRKGAIVRTLEEYGFPHHFRVTVGTPRENKFFIEKLKEVMEGQ